MHVGLSLAPDGSLDPGACVLVPASVPSVLVRVHLCPADSLSISNALDPWRADQPFAFENVVRMA
eukprot:scaffold171866_cov21-Tisochrysis_lutea.AAC.4